MTTKRDVLRGISLVFDPLGFYSPLTIRAKILIQDLWKEKFEWDQPLPVELRDRWDAIAVDLEGVKFVKPRSYFGSSQQIQRLQVFVDASPSAFGAAAYFVNNNQTAFIMAKIRVAPLKIVGREKPTIPLMELMAALLGVQLATTIINAMKKARVDITEVTMWCDNQPVLFWIDELEPNKCKVIRNRVNKIQSFTRQYQAAWRYHEV